MQPIAYSWLAASATAPLVAVLSIWTAYVFHTYRRRWRTVDLFLLAAVSQELVAAFFSFGFAVLNLISPKLEAPCSFILWGLTSTRTFQIATLTSLVVDRALTVRWPYRYRFSVRRNQIRYHIAVLAVISLFVGVAAVFARLGTSGLTKKGISTDGCSLHPLGWDLKFSVFVFCLYGVLMLTSLVCWTDVEIHRCRQIGFSVPKPTAAIGAVSGTVSSGSVSSAGSGSTRLLYGGTGIATCGTRNTSKRPYGPNDQGTLDFRWTPVAAVALVCFAVNHLPFLVLTIIGTVLPGVLTVWYENGLLWLRLLEGLTLPIILYLADSQHKSGFKAIWDKDKEAKSDIEDDGRFRTFSGEFALPYQQQQQPQLQQKPGAFGSMTPVGIITNYRRTRRDNVQRKSNRNWIKAWSSYTPNYGVDAVLANAPPPQARCNNHFRKFPFASNLHTVLSEDFIKKGSLAKIPSVETDLPNYSSDTWKGGIVDEEDENHIYASLSDKASNFSFQSTLPDESVLAMEDEFEEDVYGGSFTTVANDDFEFHDTRPCGGEVRMRPTSLDMSPQVKPHRSSPLHQSACQSSNNVVTCSVVAPDRPESRGAKSSIHEEFLQMIQKHKDLSIVQEQEEDEEQEGMVDDDDDDDDDKLSSTSSGSIRDLIIRVDRSNSHVSSSFSKTDSGISPGSNQDLSIMHVYQLDAEELRRASLMSGSATVRKKTSFSMNDLDRIGSPVHRMPRLGASSRCSSASVQNIEEVDECEEPSMVNNKKSESMTSLCRNEYRPHSAQPPAQPSKSQSETNLVAPSKSPKRVKTPNPIETLWESCGRSSSSSSLLGDHCVRKAKEHIKSKKYKVHERKPSRKRKKTVSLNSIHRVGSDAKSRSSIPDFRHFAPPPLSYQWTEVPPMSSNFRLQRPPHYSDVFGYYNFHNLHRTKSPTRKCTITGFI